MTKATSLALGIVLAAAGVALARAAQAQSLTAGGLAGTVKNNLGEPLDGVSVTVIDAATGVTRAIGATRRGVFKFALLPPGEYEVVVELIGFRPRHVVHVPVRSGLVVETTVALSLAEAPFTAADTTVFPPGVFEGGAAGVGELFPLFAARGLPDRSRSLDDYTAFSTLTDRSLQIDGLPGSLSSYLIDGIPYRPARVPAVSGTTLTR